MLTSKKCIFRVLKLMLSEAFCLHSEHSYACEELYEVPGGNQVDGLPPARSIGKQTEKRSGTRCRDRQVPPGIVERRAFASGPSSDHSSFFSETLLLKELSGNETRRAQESRQREQRHRAAEETRRKDAFRAEVGPDRPETAAHGTRGANSGGRSPFRPPTPQART